MKIHAFPPSPRAFKVLLVANHLGSDYELCFCDLTKGAQKSDAYTLLNPNQKMPALEDGDLKLWESNAIIEYLAAKSPEARLMPSDQKASGCHALDVLGIDHLGPRDRDAGIRAGGERPLRRRPAR